MSLPIDPPKVPLIKLVQKEVNPIALFIFQMIMRKANINHHVGFPKNLKPCTNSLHPYKNLDKKGSQIAKLSLHVDNKVEEHSIMDQSHGEDEYVTQRYVMNSDFCNSHNSLHRHDIATISCKDDGLVESFNVGTQNFGVKYELCVVDSCHKHSNFLYHPLEDVNKTQT